MTLGDSVGLLAAVTALLAAVYRYGGVLSYATAQEVERLTAVGFFTGLMLGGALTLGALVLT